MEKLIYRKHYKDYRESGLEERAIHLAQYMVEHNATVRQTAAVFGVSKSTVHTEVTK